MRVFSSHDSGASWQTFLILTPDDWSVGYSSMAALRAAGGVVDSDSGGQIGCLYESRVCQNPALCPMGVSYAAFGAVDIAG